MKRDVEVDRRRLIAERCKRGLLLPSTDVRRNARASMVHESN